MEDPKQTIKDHAELLRVWLFGNSTPLLTSKKAIKALKKVMGDVSPSNNIPIYRGLRLSNKDVVGLLEGKSVSLPNKGLESWTTDPEIAFDFTIGNESEIYMDLLVSRKKPKKDTIVVDFNAAVVQKTMRGHLRPKKTKSVPIAGKLKKAGINSALLNMKREHELVTTPQCDKCRLSDVELIWVALNSDIRILRKLGVNLKQLGEFRQMVSIQGKNKYKLMPPLTWFKDINLKRIPRHA